MKRNKMAAAALGASVAMLSAAGIVSPAPVQAQATKNKVGKTAAAAPKKLTERDVFLTPGGLYTKADIKANGNQTVSQKYPNFMAEHDAKPKKGQRVCPITDTVANPKLTWIVGGKTYQFCCPPCVTEFVKKAKTNPKAIKSPQAYVQTS
jgi:YHS domain-containing protein